MFIPIKNDLAGLLCAESARETIGETGSPDVIAGRWQSFGKLGSNERLADIVRNTDLFSVSPNAGSGCRLVCAVNHSVSA
jgi:hypothetical protein